MAEFFSPVHEVDAHVDNIPIQLGAELACEGGTRSHQHERALGMNGGMSELDHEVRRELSNGD